MGDFFFQEFKPKDCICHNTTWKQQSRGKEGLKKVLYRWEFEPWYLYLFYFFHFSCITLTFIESWRWWDFSSLVFFKFFYHVMLFEDAIDELPLLFWIWWNPKANNTTYHKDLFKDWSLDHLEDCGWYIESLLKFQVFQTNFSCPKNPQSDKCKKNPLVF